MSDGSGVAPPSRRAPRAVTTRSNERIIHSELDVKSWMQAVPSVDAARPRRCPGCGAAGRPEGRARRVVGHGVRERVVLGPIEPEGSPGVRTILARRYRCLGCRAVLTVVPSGVARRMLYTVLGIVLAISRWSVDGQSPIRVRAQISPFRVTGPTAAAGWASLRRWVRKASAVFPGARPPPAGPLRERAIALLSWVASFAPRTTGALRLDAVSGAVRATRWTPSS